MKVQVFDIRNYPPREQIQIGSTLINVPSVYTGRGVTAVFPVSSKKAAEFINSDYIMPTILWPGRAAVVVTIFDFHTSPVGPYSELVYSIPVLRKSLVNLPFIPMVFNKYFSSFGVFVVDIMQSTKIAVEHGNILTGYPHSNELVEVKFNNSNDECCARVYSKSDEVLSLRTTNLRGKSSKVFRKYRTYFKRNNRTFQIRMDIYGTEQKTGRFRLELAQGKLTDVLRGFNISHDSLEGLYYNDVTEVNPVTLESL